MSFLPGWHPAPAREQIKDIEYRFVGNYTASFSGSATATFDIDAADLQLGPADRQLLFFVNDSDGSGFARTLQVGAQSVRLFMDFSNALNTFYDYYEGTSTVTIEIAADGSHTGDWGVQVWEVVNAHPVICAYWDESDDFGSSSFDINDHGVRISEDGVVLWGAWRDNNNGHSWSGDATEESEHSVASERMSTAYFEATANEDPSVTVSISGFGTSAGQSFFLHKKDAACVGPQRYATPTSGVVSSSTSITIDGDMSTLFGDLATGDSMTVLIFVTLQENTTISGITYGGVSMTRIAQANNTSASPDLIHECWQLDNVAALGDDVVTFAGSITADINVNTAYVQGSVGTPDTSTGNSTGANATVSVADKGAVVCSHMRADHTQLPSPTGVTSIFTFGSTNDEYSAALGMRNGLDADASYSVGFSDGSSGQWSQIVVPIDPPV